MLHWKLHEGRWISAGTTVSQYVGLVIIIRQAHPFSPEVHSLRQTDRSRMPQRDVQGAWTQEKGLLKQFRGVQGKH